MKTLSINDVIEQEKGPIWVLNSSNEKYKTGADVFITFVNNGRDSVMSIPRTWLPWELTRNYPRKVILESPYFVDALNKGMIKLITEDTARKILGQSGAEREQKRLDDIREAIEAATASKGIGKNVSISTGDLDRDEELQRNFDKSGGNKSFIGAGTEDSPGTINFGEDEEIDPISPNFRAWVNKLNDMSEAEDALSEVKMRGNMSMEEAEFLMNNCIHEMISSGVAKRLKKLKG